MLAGIFVVGLARKGLKQLTKEGEQPAWSPDGRVIAFVSERDGVKQEGLFGASSVGQVYVMDADGTNQQRLSRTATDDGSPAWSRDGEKIAFSTRSSELFTTDTGVVVADADGGHQRRRFVKAYDTEPAWSRDGRWLVVVCEPELARTELCAARADGGGPLLRLTSNRTMESAPAWQPRR